MRVRVKMCGITRRQDADTAIRHGADAIGLVFYPPSPRSLTLGQAHAIVHRLPPFVSRVALFVNPTAAEVAQVLDKLPIDLLQFHGDESPEFCAAFNVPYLKVVRMKAGIDLAAVAREHAAATAMLLDTYIKGVAGGTGQSFDWSRIPNDLPMPLVLSGGLGPENIETAIGQVRPYAVDVSSGIESAPGIKDAGKIAAFMQGVRNVSV